MTLRLAHMLIGELIELKSVRPVIQLGRPDDQQEALEQFVQTQDIISIIKDLSKRLHRKAGGGVFLKGHYGTGKSHLLSWLTHQAMSGWVHFPESTPPTPYLVTSISLIRHDCEQSLESIVSQQSPWASESKDRQQKLTEIMEHCQQKQLGGWFILLDELSEFLKSKSSPAALAEDMRFLQFCAESGLEHPIWIVGAIQEDIDGIGSADRETSLKLKDRFQCRWNLTQLHVEQMISERLIVHLDPERTYISRLFDRCEYLWPHAFTSNSSFLQSYPLHPDTLDFLMGLGSLFSEHRGALRFTQDVCCGLWPTGELPLLEQPAHHLICPDLLFDYFYQRLEENLEFKEFATKAWTHLQAKVKSYIEPRDHNLALRSIKLILLSSIDARKEGIDISTLNGMLMFQIDGDPHLGETYLQDHVLGKLQGRVNYLLERQQQWSIDLRHQSQELLQKLIERTCEGTDLTDNIIWSPLMELLDSAPLMLKSSWALAQDKIDVAWLNSRRLITLGFGAQNEDADLRILKAGERPEHSHPLQLTWIPRSPHAEERKVLMEAAAILRIADANAETELENQAKAEAKKRKRSDCTQWRTTMEGLFKDGKWYLGDHPIHIPLSWVSSSQLEHLLEPPCSEKLNTAYPLFRTIAPKIPYYTDQSYSDLLEHFVIPGELSEAQMKSLHLEDAIRGLASPLGIVDQIRKMYRFTWEPNQNPFISAFCDACEQKTSLTEAFKELNSGPWGCPMPTLRFLACSAILSGHMLAFKEQNALNPKKVSLLNLDQVEHLEPASALEPHETQQLLGMDFFAQADHSYSGLSLVKHLWDHTQKALEPTSRWLTQLDETECEDGWLFIQETLHQHQAKIKSVQRILEPLEQQPLLGLRQMIVVRDDMSDFCLASEWIKTFLKIYQKSGQLFQTHLSYLSDDFIDSLPSNDDWIELLEDRRALVKEANAWSGQLHELDQIERWCQQCEHWITDYQQRYEHFHRLENQSQNDPQQERFKQLVKKLSQSLAPSDRATCLRKVSSELKAKPFCRCGFSPKAKSPQGDDANEEWLQKVIIHIQQTLTATPLRTSLLDALEHLEWTRANSFLEQVLQATTPSRVIKRSLNQLIHQFKGKKMKRADVLAHIETWLGDPSNEWIEIDE